MQPTGCLGKTNKTMTHQEQRPAKPPSRIAELREQWRQLPGKERHLLRADGEMEDPDDHQ